MCNRRLLRSTALLVPWIREKTFNNAMDPSRRPNMRPAEPKLFSVRANDSKTNAKKIQIEFSVAQTIGRFDIMNYEKTFVTQTAIALHAVLSNVTKSIDRKTKREVDIQYNAISLRAWTPTALYCSSQSSKFTTMIVAIRHQRTTIIFTRHFGSSTKSVEWRLEGQIPIPPKYSRECSSQAS